MQLPAFLPFFIIVSPRIAAPRPRGHDLRGNTHEPVERTPGADRIYRTEWLVAAQTSHGANSGWKVDRVPMDQGRHIPGPIQDGRHYRLAWP